MSTHYFVIYYSFLLNNLCIIICYILYLINDRVSRYLTIELTSNNITLHSLADILHLYMYIMI